MTSHITIRDTQRRVVSCCKLSASAMQPMLAISARKNNLVPEQSHSPPTQGTSLTACGSACMRGISCTSSLPAVFSLTQSWQQLYASFLLCAAPLARDLNDSKLSKLISSVTLVLLHVAQ